MMTAMSEKPLLGRFKVTTQAGMVSDAHYNDASYDKIVGYGGRGFSIYKINKAGSAVDTIEQVFER